MSNNQNKQVTTKFQNAHKSVTTKFVQPKVAYTRSATLRLNRTTLARSLKPTATVQPSISEKLQLESQAVTSLAEPTQPAESAESADSVKPATSETEQQPKELASATTTANASTRTRAGAATLAKNTPIFNTLSRRVYRSARSNIFDYDLSNEEKRSFEHSCNPMKSVPTNELQLLRSGQRSTYLETRYERSPDVKYNYPEATSWRYGWFHGKTA